MLVSDNIGSRFQLNRQPLRSLRILYTFSFIALRTLPVTCRSRCKQLLHLSSLNTASLGFIMRDLKVTNFVRFIYDLLILELKKFIAKCRYHRYITAISHSTIIGKSIDSIFAFHDFCCLCKSVVHWCVLVYKGNSTDTYLDKRELDSLSLLTEQFSLKLHFWTIAVKVKL